ncbi:lipopolysaccharide biosynthesis protein RfbH [Parablautia muri]|uniref:Lipopolysaccharide biosynthesis protein RfbH n=1 Tax=Parablautia muri TaxID=2320879 RepID=A0A9X5BF78_9FIRM|nr:lipopolysaccharide biosynthesis protein RfbH [Parablautia muri]NBJ92533.1 lipopolysaccharide biosynthesis protein RfbH [Parablautia muri]
MKNEIRDNIRELVIKYYEEYHVDKKEYMEGDRIQYSGRIYDSDEMVNLVDAALEFWLTAGHYVEEFEMGLAEFLNIKHCTLVNSGSSANLCAFMALTSSKLGDRRINKGDEVITVAAAFPTTVTPIIQYGAIPVFLDVTIPDYNIDINRLEEARSKKTKAVFIAHTLGNPFNLQYIKDFCDKYNLWLIEDNCDALGTEYFYNGEWRKTGTIGDLSTYSFYPPHHITLGEGGAVCTNNTQLFRLVNSFRDWGRDCWCASGVDDTCKHRYTQQFGELPLGYDHKYVYSHFGYNLKPMDLQAAVGCAQLKKLPKFVAARKRNWKYLKENLKCVEDFLILPEPTPNSAPSWFGFLMTVKKNAGFTRSQLAQYLEGKNIQTRNLFSGNFIKHPCFDEMRKTRIGYRVVGDLSNTDIIMNQSLWIGVYPGMNQKKLEYMVKTIKEYVNTYKYQEA